MTDSLSIKNLPIGPELRQYLQWGASSQHIVNPPEDLYDQFSKEFIAYSLENTVKDFTQFLDLLEELVAMKCFHTALTFSGQYSEYLQKQDFRLKLSMGVAYMGSQDFELAESFFYEANEIVPEEIAPQINLMQIFLQTGRADSALEWGQSLLELDLNHVRVWELIAQALYQKHAAEYLAKFEALVNSKNSWVARSMLAEYLSPDDGDLRMEYLQPFYDQGERSFAFMVEYTAALGVSGQYDRILTCIWQLNSQYKPSEIPWQISLHKIQALMGLEQFDKSLAEIDLLIRKGGYSDAIAQTLEALRVEIDEELSD